MLFKTKLFIILSFLTLLKAQEIWFLHPKKFNKAFLESQKVFQKNGFSVKHLLTHEVEKKFPKLVFPPKDDQDILYLLFYKDQILDANMIKENETIVDLAFRLKEAIKDYQKNLKEEDPSSALDYAYWAYKSNNRQKALFWLFRTKREISSKKALVRLLLQN